MAIAVNAPTLVSFEIFIIAKLMILTVMTNPNPC